MLHQQEQMKMAGPVSNRADLELNQTEELQTLATQIVSDNSEVRFATLDRFPNYLFGTDGSVWSRKNTGGSLRNTWRPLKTRIHSEGYRSITLSVAGKAICINVHRAVLEAFLGPCPEGFVACHWDNDRANAALSNLRWDTPESNHADMLRHGTALIGEKCPTAKLKAAQVTEIKSLLRQGKLQREIGEMFGVTQTTISAISRGILWRHHVAA